MRIFLSFLFLVLFSFQGGAQLIIRSTKSIERQLEWVKDQLENPNNGKVLFAAHRGDWRNAPENSIQSLIFSIENGYDIVECDLKMTMDGQLIIMHDKTIDRTTTGTGKPEIYSLELIKKFKLRNATGHATEHTIPTLEEFLSVAKGRIMVCVDKGFEYFDKAMEIVKKFDMENQIIFNIPSLTFDSLQNLKIAHLTDKLWLNVLGFPNDITKAENLVNSYKGRGRVIFHPTFSEDRIPFVGWMKKIRATGGNLWLNGLWPEHNGGHDDDKAVELNMKDDSWGWLIKNGATIIQTDRPKDLLQYLVSKGYHPKF